MDLAIAIDALREFIQVAAIVLEAIAALIILTGAGWALTRYIQAAFRKPNVGEALSQTSRSVRIGFGRSLLLALEFTVRQHHPEGLHNANACRHRRRRRCGRGARDACIGPPIRALENPDRARETKKDAD